MPSQEELKKLALHVLSSKDGKTEEKIDKKITKDFKKPLKRTEEVVPGRKKLAIQEFSPDTGSEPRSVSVRGAGLSPEILQKTFSGCGVVWQMRVGQGDQNAVVTFRESESAREAVAKWNGKELNGTTISVELTKKRNTTWLDICNTEATNKKYDFSSRQSRTVHISYYGQLVAQDFRNIFRDVGVIEKIYISNQQSKKTKGQYAFVTFHFEDEARRATKEVDGLVYNGIALRVSAQRLIHSDSSIASSSNSERDSRDLVTYDID